MIVPFCSELSQKTYVFQLSSQRVEQEMICLASGGYGNTAILVGFGLQEKMTPFENEDNCYSLSSWYAGSIFTVKVSWFAPRMF